MTNQHGTTVTGYAAGSVRHLFSLAILDERGQIGTAVVALIAFVFGSANVGLLYVVLAAMLLDLVVGSMAAAIDPLEDFCARKLYGGFLGKFFRLLFIPAASLIDWLYISSPIPVSEGYQDALPITAFAMIGLATAEITSSLAKFKNRGVAPGLIAAVMRHLDRIKLGEEPPARREYDKTAIMEEERRHTDREK